MDAVLAHAVADGWIEDGGVGTGFPISKGRVRGFDYATDTVNTTNLTESAGGGAFTDTRLRLGVGVSPADATTNAATGVCIVPNMSFPITEWHIFSDPASGVDYVHVVAQFSNGVNGDVFQHFSFGEIDRQGFGHSGIAYAASRNSRGYAVDGSTGNAPDDWNSLSDGSWPFAGAGGEGDAGSTETCYIIDGTSSPVNPAASYPSADEFRSNGSGMWDCIRAGADLPTSLDDPGPYNRKLTYSALVHKQRIPFSSAISLMPLPFVLINGTGSTSRAVWCGQFPDVRYCSMEGYGFGDEITYAGDTWKIFPWLRSTPDDVLGDAFVVTSGRAGMAYKKVV